MKSLKKILRLTIVPILTLCFSAFADVKIVSPAVNFSSVWANKQVLVVNVTEGEEIYYSFTGTDPLETGFAYDEPVLIDMTGDVELRVSSVNKKHQRSDYIIKYTVDESLVNTVSDFNEINFIKKLDENHIYNLKCGEELDIPAGFDYSISCVSADSAMEEGRTVYVSKDSTLDRYASLTLKSSSNSFWNYVIHVNPVVKGEFTKAQMPFEIENWSTVKLVDNKYIYSIDDGWWQRCGQDFEIDRSVSHTVKWQSVDYDPFNPVESFEIPATPLINCVVQPGSSVEISLEGNPGYRFANSRSSYTSYIAPGLHEKIVVDAFQGENFATLLPVDVYYENVYQGQLYASVQVNRKKPGVPKIVLNDTNEICRDDVSFNIIPADDEHNVQYYVMGPVSLSLQQLTGEMPLSVMAKINENAFNRYDGKSITLTAKDDVPSLYKVYAYSIDKWDNISDLSVVDVIIDKCSYFINPASAGEQQDGTFKRPFSDLSKVEDIVNSRKWTNFYVYGRVNMRDLTPSIKRSCQFTGIKNAQIAVDEKSAFYVSGGSLNFQNVLLKSSITSGDSKSVMINIIDGLLTADNCEFSFGRNKNAVLINAVKSTVNIKKSGLSSYANDYACVVAAANSKVNLSKCRVSTAASTNVCFSVKGSNLGLYENTCTIDGLNGRILELFSSKANLELNSFNAKNLSDLSKNEAIWVDEKSSAVEVRNVQSGF